MEFDASLGFRNPWLKKPSQGLSSPCYERGEFLKLHSSLRICGLLLGRTEGCKGVVVGIFFNNHSMFL